MEKENLVLCDTNIIIEFYKENITIIDNLKKIGQENIAVSIITAGELIYGALNKIELNQIRKDLFNLKIIDIDYKKGNLFIDLMSKYSLSHNLTLPDAFIAATAIEENLPLFTLNVKDFQYMKSLNYIKVKYKN